MPSEKVYSDIFINYLKTHDIHEKLCAVDNTNQLREQIIERIDEMNNKIFEPAYDDNVPLPGEDFEVERTESSKTLKETANDTLVAYAAKTKLKKEKEAYDKLSIEEKIKDFYIKQSIKNWKNYIFDKCGREPSGKELRSYKRKITSGYGKKKNCTPTPVQKREIEDYLNMPSSSEDINKSNPMKNQNSTGQNISSLLSSI